MSLTDNKPSPSTGRPGLFSRYWPVMLAVWLIGSIALGVLIRSQVMPAYKALSLIRVDPATTNLFNLPTGNESLDAFMKTQVELITSANVLTAAGTNPKVAVLERMMKSGDIVQDLRKTVDVSIVLGTYLIEVSVISDNAYESATIVNAVVESFLEANSEWSDGLKRAQIKNLEQYKIDLQNQIDELERRWKTLVAKNDVDLQAGAPGKDAQDANRISISIEEYRQILQDLNALKLELAEAQALLTAAKLAGGKSGEPQILLDKQVERRMKLDPEIIALASEVMKAREKLADLRRTVPQSGDPAEKKVNARLQALQDQYTQLYETRSKAVREELELGNATNSDREIQEASSKVEKLKTKQVSLKSQMEKLEVKTKVRATDAVEITLIQDERKTLREMEEAVIRRLEQLRYEAKGEARIRPVNANGATVPRKPISDRRPLFLAITPFAMLVLVVSMFAGFDAWCVSRARARTEAAKAEPEAEV